VFHVQLRQFPNVARAFNLTREQLQARVLAPWGAGEAFELSERRWSPERVKVTIYEGPELRPEEIGMGRGWANAARSGEDVTDRLLEEARRPAAKEEALEQLRQEIVSRCGTKRLRVRDSVTVAGELHRDWLVSDRLALAEQAVWELLHLGVVRLVRTQGEESGVVDREQWQPLLLAWSTWTGDQVTELLLEVSEQ
jgi:hypothetical protein